MKFPIFVNKKPDSIINTIQHLLDDFYHEHGDCCAGCDWWRWHNSLIGDCIRSAPVGGEERAFMLGMISCSLEPEAGHIMTPRDHCCGEFIDTYDWDS